MVALSPIIYLSIIAICPEAEASKSTKDQLADQRVDNSWQGELLKMVDDVNNLKDVSLDG